MYQRDGGEAAARRKARKERDDASPRLRAVVPAIVSLDLEIDVSRDGTVMQALRHVKRCPVEHAPAVFVIDCTDRECRDGGHDLTEEMLSQLRAGRERFHLEQRCPGRTSARDCGRVATVRAVATYARAPRRAR